jgi:periplasmic copper chaperone A
MNTRISARVLALIALIGLIVATIPRVTSAHEGGPHFRVAHLAPSAGAVDIYINDKAVLTNVRYKDVSRYIGVDGREFSIGVVAAGGKASELLTKAPLRITFDEIVNGNYTITAVGSPADGTFELFALPEDGVQPAPSGDARDGNLEITGAFARPTIKGGTHDHNGHGDAKPTESAGGTTGVSAAYMKIANTSDTPDMLVSVTADVGDAEIHETIVKDDIAAMRAIPDGLEVPAKGSVELKPGSYHIMLIRLKKDLKAGDVVKLTLNFKSGTQIALDVPVKAPESK